MNTIYFSNLEKTNLENLENNIKINNNTNIFDSSYIFDTSTALSGLYLWLLFGYSSRLLSCDIQKLMTGNVIFHHILCLVSFFLLFTIMDNNSRNYSLLLLWKKTFFVYFIFILMIKSKIYFTLPVLLLLVIDQHLKIFINKIKSNNEKTIYYTNIRNNINNLTIGIIIAGFIHYVYRQYNEFGDKFSMSKLLFTYTCNMDK
jgi:hypothetical protein